MGNLYHDNGDYAKALENYNKSLEIRAKISGAESIEVAKILNNIGMVYKNKGDLNKALEIYKNCLDI